CNFNGGGRPPTPPPASGRQPPEPPPLFLRRFGSMKYNRMERSGIECGMKWSGMK
ncbi:hypothetical protein A2U01_0094803, partial [Trifolium medium]|nr:hypothetical protein [Trifolium medium]